jgi:predicted AAA+ superfamily ATPase
MLRSAKQVVQSDLDEKLVFISGPRQCGKTTFAKSLYKHIEYFNYDIISDRLSLKKLQWKRDVELVVFDEIHKMRGFKRWLKGVVDGEGVRPRLLVTGSAKLDAYRRVGDSLAGRFLQHRMHPLDLLELNRVEHGGNMSAKTAEEMINRLLRHSGFPEPFLKQSDVAYRRWQQSHLDVILRQDLLELENVRDVKSMETLVELLRERTGGGISVANLARDLERDPKTIKLWLEILERLFVVFRVTPYSKNIARSLLKESKFYFFDIGRTQDNKGARLENLVACALLKELNRIEDTLGYRTRLHYLRTKDQKEIDFLAVIDGKPHSLFEVKWSDGHVARSFNDFSRYFPNTRRVQLVCDLPRDFDDPTGVQVRRAAPFLATLKFAGAE